MNRRRIILIHGAWHGAWCWEKLTPVLERLGFDVIAPDLPGHGDDSRDPASVTFDDHVDAVCGALDAEAEPATLLAHSMAGLPVTAAAERAPAQIRRLIYLSALLPAPGENLFDIAARNPRPIESHLTRARDRKSMRVREDRVRALFYQDCDARDAAWAQARLGVELLDAYATPVQTTAANYGRVARSYIECEHDAVVPLSLQREMHKALEIGEIYRLPSGHSPFISQPEKLAGLLDKID